MRYIFSLAIITLLISCKKEGKTGSPPVNSGFKSTAQQVNEKTNPNRSYYGVSGTPVISISFSDAVDKTTVSSGISLVDNSGISVAYSTSYQNSDSTVVIQPLDSLKFLTSYIVTISRNLRSAHDSALQTTEYININTAIDSTDKFPRISDSALLTLVEQQTFKYFYDFAHATSGMALERNSSGNVVTTGGSGFGVMALLTGIQRNFISRAEGLARATQIVDFLTNHAQRYHGAFPHWMDGGTGATIPFSTQDDGADLVETAYMMQGLLCARQFFNSNTDAIEIALRAGINNLWNGVEWNWFRQGNQNTLYWHWSPDYQWSTNQQVNGWDEALITYVLAASSPVDSNRIPKIVYDNGWALNGGIKNGNTYYGTLLPLGPPEGGPLFFAHYSFLGINPQGLSDAYANYWQQDSAHARINYSYCVANPGRFYGYSAMCWGLTASDENNGYDAHSPTNDDGVISPTAAISSLPYTPVESMNALRFFYYTLGDKLWGQYGFVDAFNLTNIWFASSYLAIDQGPEIVMIENYRSGLLWNLFMSCPEVKTGLKSLGFQGVNLN
jgi:hypothetical protein